MTIDFNNVEIPRDRWGRPMILPPKGKGTKRIPYRRTTTFVGCLDDQSGLMKWLERQVAYGMGQRSDLVLAASATDPADKKALGVIAEQAKEAAAASAAATRGTALHTLTERIDRGHTLGNIPAEFRADIDAYRKATDGIEFTGIETFRIHDDWQVAGTADRIGIIDGRPTIMDIKTGSIDFPHKMAMQLAIYARSTPYDIATDTRIADAEPVDLNRGIIIHLPAGQGTCELVEIDISKGWGACLIARQVWSWRGTKDLVRPLRPHAAPATWESLALGAADLPRLRELWKRAAELGQLTDDLQTLIVARSKEIG